MILFRAFAHGYAPDPKRVELGEQLREELGISEDTKETIRALAPEPSGAKET